MSLGSEMRRHAAQRQPARRSADPGRNSHPEPDPTSPAWVCSFWTTFLERRLAAPPDILLLEDSEKAFKDHEPTLREVLALHREKPLCASCHDRMDPLGLALENFNALGIWREKERNQRIDAGGMLITGESFKDIHDLKRILKAGHRTDFYRCLTEKLLTYALGRGLDYYDVGTVDEIVERLEKSDGRFSALLMGIVESSPFQKRRNLSVAIAGNPDRTAERLAQTK